MYSGKSCEIISCPYDCSSRGICDHESGKCICNSGFSGSGCESVNW